MKTHDLGRLYWHRFHYPTEGPLPRIEKGWTAETEEPYRIGHCLVFRRRHSQTAFAIGWWGKPGLESQTLALAIGFRELEGDEANEALYS